ncbi:MAG TPA: LPXTG cell wall anchor domain-containing protein [Clostridiaceae bacterium]|nr:LPXTG cell wall anchor domain-containing protein [Clostridiaceae bacterium]
MKRFQKLTITVVIVALLVMMFPTAFAFANPESEAEVAVASSEGEVAEASSEGEVAEASSEGEVVAEASSEGGEAVATSEGGEAEAISEGGEAEASEVTQQVIIFHTNDIHGRAEGTPAKGTDKEGKEIENEKGSIGYARYKTILNNARQNGSKIVLALDAGDAIHGTNFATLSNGKSMIELMNMVRTDAMACGNHEFNYGKDQLKALEGEAKFPIMGANITDGDDYFTNDYFFKVNSKIFDRPGLAVAVIGLTTPETKVKADPRHTAGLSFGGGPTEGDLEAFAKIAQAEIDHVKGSVNAVILLVHLGVDKESAIRTDLLIPKLTDVDLVIDGHSHTTLPEGTVIKDKDGADVLVAQAGSYFENIGKVTMLFAEDGKLLNKKAELLTFKDVRDVDEDEAIKAKIDEFNKANDVVLEKVIGKTAVDLDGERANVRAGETNLGNLIADSLLKASKADVVLTNGGGIRASIPAGDITMGDAMTVLPFGNLVTVIKVSGQDIIDALAFGAKSYPELAGGFPHVAGMTYTILTDAEGKFSKIGEVKVGGEPIDPAKTYTLATNDFLASGGDGYDMFGGKEQVTLLGLMLDIFVDEIKALSKEGAFTVEKDGRLIVKPAPEFAPVAPTLDVPKEQNKDNKIVADKDVVWYYIGKSVGITCVVSDAELEDLVRVTLGDKELKEGEDYTAEKGSIIIKLTKKFLSTLAKGEYLLSIETTKGTVTKTIKVVESGDKEVPALPATGESTSWIVFAGGVLIALGAAMVVQKKKIGEDHSS